MSRFSASARNSEYGDTEGISGLPSLRHATGDACGNPYLCIVIKTTMDRNQQYKANKEAKVGETIICPVCGEAFIKKQYSQAFCCGECKDKFWNKRGDRHRKGYHQEYNKKHPERIARLAGLAGNAEEREEWNALHRYLTDKGFKRYVDEGNAMIDDGGCYVPLSVELKNYEGGWD